MNYRSSHFRTNDKISKTNKSILMYNYTWIRLNRLYNGSILWEFEWNLGMSLSLITLYLLVVQVTCQHLQDFITPITRTGVQEIWPKDSVTTLIDVTLLFFVFHLPLLPRWFIRWRNWLKTFLDLRRLF